MTAPSTLATLPQPLYDLTMIHKMSRGNEAFLRRTKQLFVDTVPQTLQEIQSSFDTADWSTVSASAHKLKATIDALRIESLKTIIRQVEQDAKEQTNLHLMGSNLELIVAVMSQVTDSFKEELAAAV
ncbi:Hpt domain-containing protein [Pontibacter qinzhouensis]|uniref:Hpt domain-containing protein n=1 Tax=Pontibacter qinzhouensis TaxID=2603253 RepID=A0A5C8K9N7_9BACT|nr:Hpt domain-containing protein [Pontibacter qinzhouensis]TXK46945.1 Hpt domain-containing protein [Pontibacter qinzhouensis]